MISFEWEVCHVSFEMETFSTGHRSYPEQNVSSQRTSRDPLGTHVKASTQKTKGFSIFEILVLFDSPTLKLGE